MEILATGKRHDPGHIASIIQVGRISGRALMEVAHLAPKLDPTLAPIVADWDRMKPALRNAVNLDSLCGAHNVDPAHFIGVIGEAEMRFRGSVSILIAALNMPAVVAAAVRAAKKKAGMADRKMLLEHAGLLPVARGKQLRMLNHAAVKAEVNRGCGEPLPTFETAVTEIEESLKNDK